ncbi:E3 ubiquitin-protein ligase NHLRC1-like [Brachyhypopomus gauderio]|uniref:E3 ubiquitin-protein ligase NHLRC1-like n=1 Tax=Brachyhypopomus gauderio TaxID=698409 RepID=UPI0040424CF8
MSMSEPPVSQSGNSGRRRRAEEILAEIHSDLLECKVCFEMFSTQWKLRRPRNLPCGHVICLECVYTLAHRAQQQLECPFCRRLCDVNSTSDCQALVALQELLTSETPRPSFLCPEGALQASEEEVGVMRLRTAFGGWGRLINPTGLAVFGPSGAVLVVHGGPEKATVFSPQGERLHGFGRSGHGASELCHPLDVAVTPGGHVVVTDAGDRSVKMFSSRGRPLASIIGPFELPWGVNIDSHGHILVTDAQAGTLWQMRVDFVRGEVLVKRVVVKELQCPRAVASCSVSGRIAVLEHGVGGHRRGDTTPVQLKLFGEDFILLMQMDSFGLNLMTSTRLDASSIAFDGRGGLVVSDARRGLVWSVRDLNKTPVLTLLVVEGLLHPVGLVKTGQNLLIVLDSGDHTVKIYSAGTGNTK